MIIVKGNDVELDGSPRDLIRECASIVVALMFHTRDECDEDLSTCHDFIYLA